MFAAMSEMHQCPQDHHTSHPGTFFFWGFVNDKVCAQSPIMPEAGRLKRHVETLTTIILVLPEPVVVLPLNCTCISFT
jgi:hypothetical protein